MGLVIRLDRWSRQIGVSSGLVAELRLHLKSSIQQQQGGVPSSTDVYCPCTIALAWNINATQLVRNS